MYNDTKIILLSQRYLEETLRKMSILHEDAFISPFVLNKAIDNMELPSRMRKAQQDESKGMMSCTEQIICTGLRYLVARDFQCIDYHDRVPQRVVEIVIYAVIMLHSHTIIFSFTPRRCHYRCNLVIRQNRLYSK